MDQLSLAAFQAESNRIEGISFTTGAQIEALAALLSVEWMSIEALIAYVGVIQPDARLRATRDVPGVRVGRHVAPPSGPALIRDLDGLLAHANGGVVSPYRAHCEYETLHPFTDGNGRSGRALWLWMHRGRAPLGFLHTFYYETLANLEPRREKRVHAGLADLIARQGAPERPTMAARQAERARRAAKWVAKLCVAAISTALLASPAGAQQAGKVSQLPFASTPTNGTELIYLVQNGISTKCTLASCVPGFAGFNLTITDSVHTVANVNHILFNGPTVGGVSPNGTVTITIPPAFDLILTDGAHTVANVNHILFTGAVVGGTTPNGTVTVSVPSPLTVTDGVNTVTPTSNLLFASGFTVSGTTPNAITTPNWATDAQIWTSVAHVFVDPAGANSAIAPTTVNESGGVFSINFGAAINVQLPLVHADCPCTVANPTGVYAGLSGNLTLTQSATGSDLIGTWGSTWKFSGGTPPTLTTTANANDVAPFYCRTTTFCVVTLIGNAE